MTPEKLLREIQEHFAAVVSQESELGRKLWKDFLELHPADIARFLSELKFDHFKLLVVQLPRHSMCQVFQEMSESMQAQTLDLLTDTGKIDALNCLTVDKMTDLFESLSDQELKYYLNLLHKKDREKVLSLLKFPPESAGGIMDTDVLALHEDFTVKQSVELIQRLEVKKELHQQIFVINERKELAGYIQLEDLVLHKPHIKIKSFLRKTDLIALAHEDQETIAQKMVHYNLMIVPVVNKDNFFLGVIPSTTLVDVIEEEASEDVYRMSAMEPVKGTYFELPFWKLLYQRSYILIVLLLAQSLSSAIIQYYEALLTGFLFVFVTMLISAGGNASSQTSAVIIQGMASGEIHPGNFRRFFKREFGLAFAMACVLGLTGFVRVYLTSKNLIGSVAVSASLATIVVVSMSIGSTIPVLLKRLNIDPAYSAGPFLATIMDILGLLIYCNISKIFLFS